MSAFTVNVELSEQLSDLGFTPEEVRREVPVLLVLKRFREGVLSSGKAAQMLGISRPKFLELLAREKIAFYDPSPDELAEEFQTAHHLAVAATVKK
jgi:predicted HTH domain antitoxin